MRTFILIILFSLSLIACKDKKEKDAVLPVEEAIPVKLAPVSSQDQAGTILLSGMLHTEDETRLSFKIGGVIDQITVEEGQYVRKGQLLASLKSTEIAAQVSQVQLSVEKAERDFLRAQNLYRDSVATLEQLQNARTGLEIAKQNLQQVVFNQQYSKIYAPSDGFVARKLSQPGELTGPGTPVLLIGEVSPSSQWILSVGAADREWAALEKGNKALVSVDAFPGKEFKAVVSRKALAADPVSGSFEVEIRVSFEKEQPAIGMFGKARVTPSRKISGYSIPYDALLEADGKKGYVFVSNDRKTVKRVEVQIGSIDKEKVVIESGLDGYAYVVISGSPYLSDQSTITINL